MISQDEFAKALRRRTYRGRKAERDELLTECAQAILATGGERGQLVMLWEKFRQELPQRLAAIHSQQDLSVGRDSFLSEPNRKFLFPAK